MVKKVLLIMVLVATMPAVVYFSGQLLNKPVLKPVSTVIEQVTERKISPTVNKHTMVVKVNEYSCGDSELYFRGSAPQELVGLDLNRLKMMYPKQKGWSVQFTPEEVVVTRKIQGLCGIHQGYRHFGLHQGHLAVYQGPLGYDAILLKVEKNIAVELLPAPIQEQLQQVANFNQLSQDEQWALKSVMEFSDELAMNTALDSFDEYSYAPGD